MSEISLMIDNPREPLVKLLREHVATIELNEIEKQIRIPFYILNDSKWYLVAYIPRSISLLVHLAKYYNLCIVKDRQVIKSGISIEEILEEKI